MNKDFNNILVAEDNPDDFFLLKQAARKATVTSSLHAVCDGYEALAYLNGDGPYSDRIAYPWPDLLLLDLNMPRVNGFEVLEWLRKQPSRGRLIVYVLTSSCRIEDVRRAYDLGANSYVMKPARLDDLIAFVTALHTWHRFVCLPSQSLNQDGNLATTPRSNSIVTSSGA